MRILALGYGRNRRMTQRGGCHPTRLDVSKLPLSTFLELMS